MTQGGRPGGGELGGDHLLSGEREHLARLGERGRLARLGEREHLARLGERGRLARLGERGCLARLRERGRLARLGERGQSGSIRRRNPRTSRCSDSEPRCVSQAAHVFSRSGECSLGLFHTRTCRACCRQPFAEQIGASSSTRPVCRGQVPCGSAVRSRPVDWERKRIELHWQSAALRQGLKARWSLRKAVRVGRRAHVLGFPQVDAADLEIGDDFRIWSAHRRTMVSGPGRLRIGHRVFVNSGTVLIAVQEVVVGDDVAFANEVYVMDSNSLGLEGRPHVEAPVRIGDGSWLGARSMVLPGVTIGRRVVAAAGSVVTRDVPDDVLVAGNPARVVRPLSYPPRCRRAWHDAWCPCPELAAAEPERVDRTR